MTAARNGSEEKWVRKHITTILLAVAMGSGGSIVAPKFMPQDWFAKDRFTGSDWSREKYQLEKEFSDKLTVLTSKVELFSKLGPDRVTENQAMIITAIAENQRVNAQMQKETVELLREMQKDQLQHFRDCPNRLLQPGRYGR